MKKILKQIANESRGVHTMDETLDAKLITLIDDDYKVTIYGNESCTIVEIYNNSSIKVCISTLKSNPEFMSVTITEYRNISTTAVYKFLKTINIDAIIQSIKKIKQQ